MYWVSLHPPNTHPMSNPRLFSQLSHYLRSLTSTRLNGTSSLLMYVHNPRSIFPYIISWVGTACKINVNRKRIQSPNRTRNSMAIHLPSYLPPANGTIALKIHKLDVLRVGYSPQTGVYEYP